MPVLSSIFWMFAFFSGLVLGFNSLFGGILAVHSPQTVEVEDQIKKGQHTLSGEVTVPSPCDELTAQAVSISSSTVVLDLHTWEEPSVKCASTTAKRSFQAITFAPAYGMHFLVYLDGRPVPFDLNEKTTQ
jgi:hypothetical protein